MEHYNGYVYSITIKEVFWNDKNKH
jgi:hypothetical protein